MIKKMYVEVTCGFFLYSHLEKFVCGGEKSPRQKWEN